MSAKYTKEEVIALKKQCFKSLNSMLESFLSKPVPIDTNSSDYLKKCALISKWLIQYTNYISFETKFTPQKLIRYKRGDIIFVNFGFNIGAEFGGEHYAVVLDNENDRNSATITVIPLSSYKPGKKIHPNDIYLGNELFEKMHLKLKTQLAQLKEQSEKNAILLNSLRSNTSTEDNDKINNLIVELQNAQKQLDLEILKAAKIKSELFTLKQGSIAKVQQITTVSKLRIYNPKSTSDPLYGIRLSTNTMKLINSKIKQFFVFDE